MASVYTVIPSDIRLIIADIDNTVITSSLNFPALKRKLATYLPSSLRPSDPPSYTLHQLIQLAPTKDLQEKMWAIVQEEELLSAQQSQLITPVVSVLSELRDQYDLFLTGLTNNSRSILLPTLIRLGLTSLFDKIYFREMVPALKPHPDGILLILKEFQVSREKAIFIGDSIPDLQAAQAAGIRFIAVNRDPLYFVEQGFTNVEFLFHALP